MSFNVTCCGYGGGDGDRKTTMINDRLAHADASSAKAGFESFLGLNQQCKSRLHSLAIASELKMEAGQCRSVDLASNRVDIRSHETSSTFENPKRKSLDFVLIFININHCSRYDSSRNKVSDAKTSRFR